jgi:predicted MFS family arabinose efflux permease
MSMPATTSPATSRRAWLVWAVGVSAYLMAFFHRVTLNVAAGDTADRLGVATGALGLFAFLQIGAYLAMQLPAGFAADRIGPRRTLALGVLAIVVGETLFALAHSLPVAVVGRALVGVGDAVTFVNVLRLVQNWFPERRQALLAALTGMAGGIGQLVATIPLERSLSDFGWTVTFVITIGAAMLVGILVLAVVRDRPPGVPAPQPDEHAPARATLAAAWRRPTTRRAFYAHVGTLGPFAVVGTIWGVPYLEHTQDVGKSTAASMMVATALTFTVCLPFVGMVGRCGPKARVAVLAVPGALQATALIALLAWPGTVAPRPLVVGVLALVGLNAAASISCFDVARRSTPRAEVSTTVALVNCGGFTGAAIGGGLIGLLLAGDATAGRFEVAVLGVLLVMTLVGLGAGSLRLLGELTRQGQREAARQPSQTAETSPAAARS